MTEQMNRRELISLSAAPQLAARASQRSFPVIGLLSSRPPLGRIEPAAETGSRATDGRPSSKRPPISL
jgi:hypothetical protein